MPEVRTLQQLQTSIRQKDGVLSRQELDAFLEALLNFRPTRVLANAGTPTSDATAGNRTMTAAEVLSGIYVRDPAGGARTDTLPTAALLVAAMTNPQVGDTIELHVVNGADAAETLTLAAGTGGAFDTNQTAAARVLPQFGAKDLRIRMTNVTPGSEAYVAYF